MPQIDFGRIPPSVSSQPKPFHLCIAENDLARFRALLELSPVGPSTYENESPDTGFGITRSWLANAKHVWMHDFDWRQQERRINAFPNFKIKVGELNIHFVGLFSAQPDAIPTILLHGWPGSFMELLPVLELIVDRYTPETLPFHVIVPSLPGYAFSDGPPLDNDFGLKDAAGVMDGLMRELGFRGYVAHGGDVGSMIAMLLSATFETCKALHVTYLAPDPNDLPKSDQDLSELEVQHLTRVREWRASGMGYALEQGTRPATIGLAISSSPLALLAWIGEKFLEWSDEPPSLEQILGIASMYWLTGTYPRTLWSYRSIMKEGKQGLPTSREKPLGYSLFGRELGIVPQRWAEKIYPNIISYGGHFPGLERPEELLHDVGQFVQQVASEFGQ